MKNKLWFPLLLLIMLLAFQGEASAQEQTISIVKTGALKLIDNAKAYDERQVEIAGELIGDVMVRGDYAWISILDDGTAISAWIEKSMLPSDANIGNYARNGDIVRLRGIFHRACPEHGGDLDIHAKTLELVSKGASVNHPVDTSVVVISLTLLVIGVILVTAWRRRERNEQ
ncbi:MAG: hypothetical protein WC820_08650 [Spirochaetales bacterium]|jgi:hypothetical protein